MNTTDKDLKNIVLSKKLFIYLFIFNYNMTLKMLETFLFKIDKGLKFVY